MGKMSEIAFLLETGDEKGLVEFFGNYGWKKSVSEIGGREFLKAFDEIKEDKTHTAGDIVYDNPLYDGETTTDDQSKDVRKNIAEMSEDEWQNHLKQIDEEK